MSERILGSFIKTRVCANRQCEWAATAHPLDVALKCCPKCGGDFEWMVGRYIFETKGWGPFKYQAIVGFRPKNETPVRECPAYADGTHRFPFIDWPTGSKRNGPPICECGKEMPPPPPPPKRRA